jgi:hypothetical protein
MPIPTIPDGWRELKEGEIVSREDKYSPFNREEFASAKSCVGLPYRKEQFFTHIREIHPNKTSSENTLTVSNHTFE